MNLTPIPRLLLSVELYVNAEAQLEGVKDCTDVIDVLFQKAGIYCQQVTDVMMHGLNDSTTRWSAV